MNLKINNVLCYITTAMDSLHNDEIVSVSVAYFSPTSIKEAKTLLFSILEEEIKFRKGDDRMRKEVQDIIDLVNHSASDLDRLPKFVSDSYNAMPPVAGFGALGNTIQSLLNEIIVLKDEISFLKQRRIDETVNIEDMNTIKEILADLKNDVRSLKSDIMTNEVIHAFGSPSAPPLWQDAFPFSLNTNFRTPMRINRASDLNPEAASYADVVGKDRKIKKNTTKNDDASQMRGARPKDRFPTNNQEGFKVVQKKRKKDYGIIGKKKLEENNNFKSAKRCFDLFIGQCELSVSSDDIVNYLKDEHSIEIIEIEKLTTRNTSVNCFKINLALIDRDKLLSEDLWPEGIVCKNFYNRIKKSTQNASNSNIK
ncbi:unnamed protein product [Rotaria magnacalcarata]|uniref:Uncharacterized protein n=1 Tax=Rotaria magnacalcarata TaxID=392030 RepID=A0A816N9Y8_9BILA|nr:unnamed protein product [Rotaria magnacalcarata]